MEAKWILILRLIIATRADINVVTSKSQGTRVSGEGRGPGQTEDAV